jgi:hypothetical protein
MAVTGRRVYDVPMTPPCQNHHLFIKPVADGLAVHPVGQISKDGDWLRDL